MGARSLLQHTTENGALRGTDNKEHLGDGNVLDHHSCIWQA